MEPIHVRRVCTIFQHMVELPEAAAGVVEDAVQHHADITFVGLVQ